MDFSDHGFIDFSREMDAAGLARTRFCLSERSRLCQQLPSYARRLSLKGFVVGVRLGSRVEAVVTDTV
jgi:hypothetical protein